MTTKIVTSEVWVRWEDGKIIQLSKGADNFEPSAAGYKKCTLTEEVTLTEDERVRDLMERTYAMVKDDRVNSDRGEYEPTELEIELRDYLNE